MEVTCTKYRHLSPPRGMSIFGARDFFRNAKSRKDNGKTSLTAGNKTTRRAHIINSSRWKKWGEQSVISTRRSFQFNDEEVQLRTEGRERWREMHWVISSRASTSRLQRSYSRQLNCWEFENVLPKEKCASSNTSFVEEQQVGYREIKTARTFNTRRHYWCRTSLQLNCWEVIGCRRRNRQDGDT